MSSRILMRMPSVEQGSVSVGPDGAGAEFEMGLLGQKLIVCVRDAIWHR